MIDHEEPTPARTSDAACLCHLFVIPAAHISHLRLGHELIVLHVTISR